MATEITEGKSYWCAPRWYM